jgi:hypothetical protein
MVKEKKKEKEEHPASVPKENNREKDEEIKKENISKIFEVEKGEKEKIVETHSVERTDGKQEISHSSVKDEREEKAPSEAQMKKEKKIFIGIILVMVGLALVFLVTYMIMNYTKTFEYNGVKFYIDKEDLKGITLYKTSLPITIEGGTKGTYNFYLRKDPRSLTDVTFEGDLVLKENLVINMTNDFNCNGDGIIAIANLVKLYNIMAVEVMKDENATCDAQGRYMFLRIENGNQTKIEQFGPSCYKIYINNCEILGGTEKFMVETLSEINRVMKED